MDYNVEKPIMLTVDASMKGLGEVLIQDIRFKNTNLKSIPRSRRKHWQLYSDAQSSIKWRNLMWQVRCNSRNRSQATGGDLKETHSCSTHENTTNATPVTTLQIQDCPHQWQIHWTSRLFEQTTRCSTGGWPHSISHWFGCRERTCNDHGSNTARSWAKIAAENDHQWLTIGLPDCLSRLPVGKEDALREDDLMVCPADSVTGKENAMIMEATQEDPELKVATENDHQWLTRDFHTILVHTGISEVSYPQTTASSTWETGS